ncbi:hypothetical protein PHYSODRAFT_328904 [Phytophthora sojae]|uniref:AP complex mu/sigma subunit domain-containing protein n=1 Tax=Phytophthora sojae (strain P6497) TaxID=1094619 RepID=G4Z4J7_PHYSP|nr:hypothetical protein PHYSODRAFT_328904 [Phytophthora sojae]EGZ20841.1 hypothetical protein PHYSODRAFT_328904 [Phytophthora sojae]|eukprot:XP_009523558.1 hypothetical protein PHYSODRAFT_328904 [Phytophthora sojae]
MPSHARGTLAEELRVRLCRCYCEDRVVSIETWTLLFVEEPHRYFGNVCELDTIFNPTSGDRRPAIRRARPQRHGERSGSGHSESSMTSMAATGMGESSTASIAAARVRISSMASLVAALSATVNASRRSFPRAQSQTSFPKSPATAPARFPNYAVDRLALTVAAKAATKLAMLLILTLAAAMLAVLLSPMPVAAMLVVLLSLCRPPPCSSCCSRCARYRYARRDAVAGLAELLADGRPCRRRHAHHAALAAPLLLRSP